MLKTVILEICIVIICYLGDNLLENHFHGNRLLHVVIDNVTHGLVGFFCWAVYTELMSCDDFLHSFICGFLAMTVDIDHFLCAKSWKLKDALSLTSRPFLHASTLIPLMTILLLTVGMLFKDNRLTLLSALFFTAVTSHHIRDATRRGIWLPPFGSTRPLPYQVYIGFTMALPLVLKVFSILLKKIHFKEAKLDKDLMMDV